MIRSCRWLAAGVRIVAFLAVAGAGCAAVSRPPSGELLVVCSVPQAGVWVDDLLVGRASEFTSKGRTVRAGFHRVEIRHPDYFAHFCEVDVAAGTRAVVTAELRPLLQ